jgi:hypothetical protein
MDDDELHNLAFEFFSVFSRFEYALKAANFHKGIAPAEANVEHVRHVNRSTRSNTPPGDIANAISFLLVEPPKKQFIGAEGLEWKDCPANTGSRSKDLFTYVRRVRSNLFHGGKFNGHWFAPERSERLLTARLAVMQRSVERNIHVRDAYNG